MNYESNDKRLSNAPAPALISAVRRLLRPLVRLLLAQGISHTYLAELLKGIYVEVAERDFQLGGRRQTDSRISLLSGVHRKDVKRLRAALAERVHVPAAISLGAQLVARWLSVPEYRDESGHPRPLAKLSREGGALSFEALVASVSKDIRSRAVLDEWLRLGVVRLNDAGQVCLCAEAFIPQKGFDEKAYYLGANLHDHLAAAAHNLQGVGAPFLERSVYYDTLTPASVEALAQYSCELGMQALEAVNLRAIALQQQDAGKEDALHRMKFGLYYFSSDEMDGDSADSDGGNA